MARPCTWQPIENAPYVRAKLFLMSRRRGSPFFGFRIDRSGPWFEENCRTDLRRYPPVYWLPVPELPLARAQS
jgi:hypothetical protein